MSIIVDEASGLAVGDPDFVPLSSALPSPAEVAAAFAPLILSASGWRKVFAPSGDEEDRARDIGDANVVVVAAMAETFADWLLGVKGPRAAVALGLDTRPTGPAIADVLARVFIAKGITVSYVFVSAAPEIMAYARAVGAFAYVSASHNPIAHNGLKFGLDSGGVLSGDEITPLIARLRELIRDPTYPERARDLLRAAPPAAVAATYAGIAQAKRAAIESYAAFSREVVSGSADPAAQEAFFAELAKRPSRVVADFNGGARTLSIDAGFLASAGAKLVSMNAKPGAIAHRIVPEGESLLPCAEELGRLNKSGQLNKPGQLNTQGDEVPPFLGYVADCDGDRGNLVYWDDRAQEARTLEAQEVFALSVLAELAHLAREGVTSPVAVAVNDPTSTRVEEIARAFGARVERAEVGEANVVFLARSLRGRGFIVRVLGEGSNGGNITHPAAVRDPLNTVFALLKLLALRDDPVTGKPGLFRLWCSRSGQDAAYRDDFTLSDVIATLPRWRTTSAFEPEAALRIRTEDHAALKRRYQRALERSWETRKEELRSRWGIVSRKTALNNGIETRTDPDDYGTSGKGGLTVRFMDSSGDVVGFVWMRGSGTEPVFRVLADARGEDPALERELLAWQRSLVLEADGEI